MEDDKRNNAGEPYPEASPEEMLAAQKKMMAGLYRLRDIISGLIALADDGGLQFHQVRAAISKSVKKLFS